jgi:DNA-binding response OmpR family regulator
MRVLVVDDERGLADDIAEGLRDQGIGADIAYDGSSAVAKSGVYPYDVIVLDRDLPDISGDHVCRIVSERDEPPMILMLTAAGAAADRVRGLTLGADDYLCKPFHFPELVLRLRALARRRPAGYGTTLRVADIELRPMERIAQRGGHELELSAKEFAVLQALLEAAPGAVTPEQLLERVWDENIDPFSRTVYVTVARLKRKLGTPAAIETSPGTGYRIASAARS